MSGPINAKDNDLKAISKIVEFLAQQQEIERSRTFLEIQDAHGRSFRYVSMKDRPKTSNSQAEQTKTDEVFHSMVERVSAVWGKTSCLPRGR
jgi:hypothetical protein